MLISSFIFKILDFTRLTLHDWQVNIMLMYLILELFWPSEMMDGARPDLDQGIIPIPNQSDQNPRILMDLMLFSDEKVFV